MLSEDLHFIRDGDFAELLADVLPLFGGGAIPRPIDLLDYPGWIPSLILVEILETEDGLELGFRYFGGKPAEFYGELQGSRTSDNPDAESRKRWLEIAETVKAHRKPMRLLTENVETQRDWLSIESLLVPVSRDAEKIDQIFCFGRYVTGTEKRQDALVRD